MKIYLPFILLSTLFLFGCPSRQQIDAEVWLFPKLPPAFCAANPYLQQTGIYRKLNDGSFEVIPYCAPEITKYIGFNNQKFQAILDEIFPKNSLQNKVAR